MLLKEVRNLSGKVLFHKFKGPRLIPGTHARSMDYDEVYFMHLTLGAVHNFPNVIGLWDVYHTSTILF